MNKFNNWVTPLRAIILMASLVLVSCEKSTGELGLDQVIDSKAVLGTLKKMPVIGYTVLYDSLQTKNPSQEIAGAYIDPYFGGVKAQFATHMVLSTLNPKFGTDAICDSVMMLVAYRGYYGDTTVPITFTVNELNEYLDPLAGVKYYDNKVFSVGTELGKITTIPRPKTSFKIAGKAYSPSLRLNLDKDYFQAKIIDGVKNSPTDFATNAAFIKYINGVQVSVADYSGALMYFNIASLSSLVRMYYRESPTDTVTKTYDLFYGVLSSGNFVSVNTFQKDYTLAIFNLANQDQTNGEGVVYSQAMSGAVTKILLPDFKALKDSNYAINRAELILPVRSGSVGNFPLPTSMLLLQQRDTFNTFVKDYNPVTGSTGGIDVGGTLVIDKFREKSYTFNITRMVNAFINDTNTVTPFLVVPASSASQSWRAVLTGNIDPIRPMEINLYYTKTKKN